jgi:pimeloyl-ACP methyl ester carboxylesterase
MGLDQHITHAIRTSQGSGRVDRGSLDLADGQPTFVALGDYRLATEFFGDSNAPTVVLLHGIPGWRGTWRSVATRLADRAYVVVPDLAGFGESSPAPAGLHAADHADLVAALIRSLGLSRVHLVGFDFGGPAAVMVCARAPDLIASLTLAATNVLTDTTIPLPLHLVRPPVLGSVFARLFFGRLGLSLVWFAAVARRDRFRFGEYREALRFPQGVRSTRRIFQASLRDLPGLYGPVQAALGSIRVPCAIVWGDRDPFFPVAIGKRTAARVPNAVLTVLKGCGHFLPQEDPDGVARAVSDLLG